MTEWRLVDQIIPGSTPIDLGGLNPWDHKWRHLDLPPLIVPHPQYPHQRHKMDFWEIGEGDHVVRFAAGEFSNQAWGFYLPVE